MNDRINKQSFNKQFFLSFNLFWFLNRRHTDIKTLHTFTYKYTYRERERERKSAQERRRQV